MNNKNIKAEFEAYKAIHPEAVFTEFINAEFNAYRAAHPESSFSDFYRFNMLERLARGERLSAIGFTTQSTHGVRAFAEGGEKVAKTYIATYGIRPEHRLLDYGCGSLRIGSHFISYLNARKYVGMDIAPEFLDIGLKAIGSTRKRPTLLTITPENIEAGRAFRAKYVISHSVHYHVHPDEQEIYFRNLAILASRRGARLLFNAKIHKTPIQYTRASWAWPMDHFLGHLRELKYVGRTQLRPLPAFPEILGGTFFFRRT